MPTTRKSTPRKPRAAKAPVADDAGSGFDALEAATAPVRKPRARKAALAPEPVVVPAGEGDDDQADAAAILAEAIEAPVAEAAPLGAGAAIFREALHTSEAAAVTFAELVAVLGEGSEIDFGYTKLYAAYRPAGVKGVVLSVIPMKTGLRLVLPLEPKSFDLEQLPGARDLTGKGHWGSGDLEVRVAPGFDPELVAGLVQAAIGARSR